LPGWRLNFAITTSRFRGPDTTRVSQIPMVVSRIWEVRRVPQGCRIVRRGRRYGIPSGPYLTRRYRRETASLVRGRNLEITTNMVTNPTKSARPTQCPALRDIPMEKQMRLPMAIAAAMTIATSRYLGVGFRFPSYASGLSRLTRRRIRTNVTVWYVQYATARSTTQPKTIQPPNALLAKIIPESRLRKWAST